MKVLSVNVGQVICSKDPSFITEVISEGYLKEYKLGMSQYTLEPNLQVITSISINFKNKKTKKEVGSFSCHTVVAFKLTDSEVKQGEKIKPEINYVALTQAWPVFEVNTKILNNFKMKLEELPPQPNKAEFSKIVKKKNGQYLEISLQGGSKLFKKTKNCPEEQHNRIVALSTFIFKNPQFLELTKKILLSMPTQESFKQGIRDVLDLESDLETKLLRKYELKIRSFYKSSLEINTDRGRILECLASLAIKAKYNDFEDTEICYHCKVEVKYNTHQFTIKPYNIDVCAKSNDQGHYIECKLKVSADYKKDTRKMNALSQFSEKLKKVNEIFSTKHIFLTLVLTGDDTPKMFYYQNEWPLIEFVGLDRFQAEYCVPI